MGILPVLKVKTESRCNLLTTILYDSSLSFSMMVKDIGPVRVLWRLKVLAAYWRSYCQPYALYISFLLWLNTLKDTLNSRALVK